MPDASSLLRRPEALIEQIACCCCKPAADPATSNVDRIPSQALLGAAAPLSVLNPSRVQSDQERHAQRGAAAPWQCLLREEPDDRERDDAVKFA